MSGCVTDSAWIHLEYVGTPNSLTAAPVASPQVGNGLQLLDDGIWVPGVIDLLGGGFPGAPHEGAKAKIAPQANVTWEFRWNTHSSAVSQWEFCGGSDAYFDVEDLGTINSSQSSGTYGIWQTLSATSTVGPQFTIPFTGTYHIAWGAMINPISGEEAEMGISVGGADPAGDNVATAGAAGASSVMRRNEMNLTEGELIRGVYRGSGGSGNSATHHFSRRWLSVTPVRVRGTRAAGTYPNT